MATALHHILLSLAQNKLEFGATSRRVHQGEVLFQQGDAADCLYLVITGRMRAVRSDERTGFRVLGEAGPGETIGEMALVSDQPRSATVIATRDCDLLRVPRAAFETIARHDPNIAVEITRIVVARLQRLYEQPTLVTQISIAIRAPQPVPALEDFVARFTAALASLLPTTVVRRSQAPAALAGQTELETWSSWLGATEPVTGARVFAPMPGQPTWTAACERHADVVFEIVPPGMAHLADDATVPENAAMPAQGPRRMAILLEAAEPPYAGTSARLGHWAGSYAHVRIGHAGDHQRLARRMVGRHLAVVLGGGAARGFAHIGFFRVVRELGLVIDRIGGASMGAIMAAEYAMGWSPERMLEETERVFAGGRGVYDFTIPYHSIVLGAKGEKLLRGLFGDLHIEDLALPYFCVSSNLTRACLVVHRRGALWNYVGVSAAIPGVFPALVENGDLLVDGGVLDEVPVDVARSEGPGFVMGINVSQKIDLAMRGKFSGRPRLRHLLASLWRSPQHPECIPSLMRVLYRTAVLSAVYRKDLSRKEADLFVDIPLTDFGGFDWKSLPKIADRGEQTAREVLHAWPERDDFRVPANARQDGNRPMVAPEGPRAIPAPPGGQT